MTILQKIERFGLDSRARELKKNGLTTRDIAESLSNESGQKITKSTVADFFKADDILKAEIVEKQEEYKIRVVEAEISTIEGRLSIIQKLHTVFESCENKHEYQIISKELREHYDSLDKRIGKVSPESNNTTINIQQNNVTIKEKIQRYRDMGLFNAQ